MKCVMCENKKVLKKDSKQIRYTQCGLDNVVLYGVAHYECNQCGEEYYSYGNQDELHTLIARALIFKSGLLSGKEVRFLRTYLGYSTAVFAKLTGYAKESISRMENQKQKIMKPFDRLVRSFVAFKLPNRDYDLHEQWLQETGAKSEKIELNNWHGWHLRKSA